MFLNMCVSNKMGGGKYIWIMSSIYMLYVVYVVYVILICYELCYVKRVAGLFCGKWGSKVLRTHTHSTLLCA